MIFHTLDFIMVKRNSEIRCLRISIVGIHWPRWVQLSASSKDTEPEKDTSGETARRVLYTHPRRALRRGSVNRNETVRMKILWSKEKREGGTRERKRDGSVGHYPATREFYGTLLRYTFILYIESSYHDEKKIKSERKVGRKIQFGAKSFLLLALDSQLRISVWLNFF